MKHLIVKALHRDESFLSKACKMLQDKLTDGNEELVVRDLYLEDFQPVLTTNDFEALKSGHLPEDIKIEQEHINNADIIWVIYPVWWTGMPAILKGYIDRVFLSGFAYEMQGNRPVGKLTNKKVIVINSMGMSFEDYQQSGTFDAMELTIDKGIFGFAGMQVLDHKYFSSIMSVDDNLREQYFSEILILAEKLVKNQKQEFQDTKSKRVA